MDISDTYVLINSVPISAPYIIKAIGNQKDLEDNLNYNNSYLNKIRNKSNTVEIYESNILSIDKYEHKRDKNKMNFEYVNNINHIN